MTSAWAFAVAAWGKPGVEAICLDLQNIHGQCPALLLWRCWTLGENRDVGPQALAKAVALARQWDGEIVRPLRALRLRLAAASDAGAARAAVRRRVLEAELEAEHALLDSLEAVEAEAAPPRGTPPLRALAELAEAWRPPAPSALLARLIEAL